MLCLGHSSSCGCECGSAAPGLMLWHKEAELRYQEAVQEWGEQFKGKPLKHGMWVLGPQLPFCRFSPPVALVAKATMGRFPTTAPKSSWWTLTGGCAMWGALTMPSIWVLLKSLLLVLGEVPKPLLTAPAGSWIFCAEQDRASLPGVHCPSCVTDRNSWKELSHCGRELWGYPCQATDTNTHRRLLDFKVSCAWPSSSFHSTRAQNLFRHSYKNYNQKFKKLHWQ